MSRSISGIGIALVFGGLFLACDRTYIRRTDYELARVGELIFVNSAAFEREYIGSPRRTGSLITVRYPLILENTSASGKYLVTLSKATFASGGKGTPLQCRSYKGGAMPPIETLVVRPREKMRIECEAAISTDADPSLILKDIEHVLEFPVRLETERSGSSVKFTYRTRIEDFK